MGDGSILNVGVLPNHDAALIATQNNTRLMLTPAAS